jgi:hypothetical protein
MVVLPGGIVISGGGAGIGGGKMEICYWAVVPYTLADGTAGVLRFTTAAVPPFLPAWFGRGSGGFDPAAHEGEPWDPVLIEPANVEIGLWSDATRGMGEVGGGALVIANADGAYNFLHGAAVAEIEVRAGSGRELAWSECRPLARLLAGPPEVALSAASPSRVTIPVRDRRELLSRLSGSSLAGTGGVEGVAARKGQSRPLAFGDLTGANVPPLPLGSGIYQAHDGPLPAAPSALYLRGGPAGLVRTGDFPGAALVSASLTAGQYCTDLARGLVRVGGNPNGALTLDMQGDAAGGYADTVPALLRRVLLRLGEPAERIGASLSAGQAARVGLYIGAEADAAASVEELCRSVMGWLVPDAAGVWQFGTWAPPVGGAGLMLGPDEILSLDAAPWGFDVPLAEVSVLWGRNYAPMGENDIPASLREGAGADPARVEYLTQEWRRAVWRSPDNAARWGDAAPKIEVSTALRSEAAAAELADRWGACFGVPRRSFRVAVAMTDAAMALPLGGVAAIDYPPAGISGLFRLVRVRPTAPRLGQMQMQFWG